MIPSLQSLRFVFAIMIFLHHFTVDEKGLFYIGGSCGVSFFMILSGFVMSIGYSKKLEKPSWNYKSYLKKRLIRIYPLHLLCLLGFITIHLFNFSIIELCKLIPNLLLFQSWIPSPGYYFSGNAVSWCLSDMLFFYICFPFLIKLFKVEKTMYKVGVIILFVYIPFLFLLPEQYTHPILYISPLFRLLDFILGIMTYHAYSNLNKMEWSQKMKKLSYTKKTLLEFFIAGILGIMLYIHPSDRLIYASYWWIIIPILILLFALFNDRGGAISTLLNNKLIVKLGEISFSFYMIHQLALLTLKSLFNKLSINMAWEFTLPLFFSIITAISFCIYTYYEKPLAAVLKKHIQ